MRLRDIHKEDIGLLRQCDTTRPYMGTDPEFFVAGPRNKVLASDKFFYGKDDKKAEFYDAGCDDDEDEKMKLFFDGIQAEINVPHSVCRETTAHYIRIALRRAENIVKKKGDKAHHLVMKPSVRVSQGVIDGADDEARRFGCMPDFNAYSGTQNTPEMDASRHLFRYAGGHIHIGISSGYAQKGTKEYVIAKTEEGHIKIIKLIDYLVGLMLIMLDKGPAANRRRTKYGKAGCFRPTPYGIEYRTPSCWWLKSPIGQSLMFGLARTAWNLCISGLEDKFKELTNYNEENVRGVLDEGNVKEAKKIWANVRPVIAVTGARTHHPLNVFSGRESGTFPAYTEVNDILKIAADGEQPRLEHIRGMKKDDSTYVFTLPAIEWMIKNGPDCIIGDNVAKEWNFGDRDTFHKLNGVITGCYQKLHNDKEYAKFQSDFYKNVL